MDELFNFQYFVSSDSIDCWEIDDARVQLFIWEIFIFKGFMKGFILVYSVLKSKKIILLIRQTKIAPDQT